MKKLILAIVLFYIASIPSPHAQLGNLPTTKKGAVTNCIDFVHQRDAAFAKFDAFLDPATNQVVTNATSAEDEQHALFVFKKCMAETNIQGER
jgi:hypothetical protein